MTEQKTISGRAWAEMILLALIWGGSFLAVSFALREVGFLTIVAHRVFWAMPMLWAIVWLRGYARPRGWRIWGAFLVMGILNNVLPFSLLVWAQTFVEGGLVSILNAATAVFGVVIAALVFADERLTRRKITGVLIGFAGVVFTIGIGNLLRFDPRSTAQLAVVLAALCYALASSWARKTMGHLPTELAAAGMLTGASVVIVPAALWIEGLPTFNLQPATFAALGFYSFVATGLAFLLYYRVMKMAGSGNLMLVTLMVPPTAIMMGALVLGEHLAAREFIGFGLVAIGLMVIDGRLPKLLLGLLRGAKIR